MSIDTRTLEWVAGFLEGEGSFTLHSSLQVSAAQVQLWPLQKLQRIFGGKIFTNKAKRADQEPCSQWYLYGSRAAAVMMTVYVLMSPRRQAQIEAALAKWKTKPVYQAMRKTCPRGHEYRRDKRQRSCNVCQRERYQSKRLAIRLAPFAIASDGLALLPAA